MRTWNGLLTMSLLLGAGCGGGGSGDDDAATPDARTIDSLVPDATPTASRAMTIAVTDVTLTSADAVAAGLKGGAIDITFDDLTQGGGELVYGTSPVGGCVVHRFDATHVENPLVGAGTVNIEAPATGSTGLLKTVGPCNYVAGAGYLCASNGNTESVQAIANGSRALTFLWTGTPFTGESLVGSYLNINGYTNTSFDTGAGALPVVSQSDNTLTVIAPANVTAGSETTSVAFTVLNGAGPIPTNVGFPVNADFLGTETTSVRVQKDADANWGAIDFTVYTRGEGFALSNSSARPELFPSVAQDVTFSCDPNDGGDCGADDTTATGVLRALIVSGKTTDGDVTGLPDYVMPPPVTAYTTFQCGFIIADSGTIPMDAVTQILATNPSRIETHVLRVAGTSGADPNDPLNTSGNIVIGHGLVGHASIAQ